jgi:soluble lytic murein transglycosylase
LKQGFSVVIPALMVILVMFAWGRHSWAGPQTELLETVAKQLAATGTPSVVHALEQLARDGSNAESAGLASFALGYWAYQREDFTSAGRYLANPNLNGLPISDYAAYYLACSRHRLKDYTGSLEPLENFAARFPQSNLITDVVQKYCQILMDANEPGRCVKLLAGRSDLDSSPRLMLMAAKAYDRDSRWPEAGRLLQRIAYDFPLSSEAGEAKDDLEELERRHPTAVHRPDPEVVRARGEVYFSQKRYRDALADFEAVAKSYSWAGGGTGPEQLGGIYLRIGECYIHLGRNREAVAALGKADPLRDDIKAEKAFYELELGRRIYSSSTEEREGAVQEMQKQYPSSPWTAAAMFSLGNYFLVHQDRPRATAQFQNIAKQFPDSRDAAEALFRGGWSAYLQRDYGEAEAAFRKFYQLYPESSRTVGSLYWLGRMAEATNSPQAGAYYGAVIHDFGESLYAQSARERLSRLPATATAIGAGIQLPELKSKFSLEDDPPRDPRAKLSIERAGVFTRISIPDLALREYRISLNRERSAQAIRELARIYLANQNYTAAMVTVRQAYPEYFRATLDQLPMEYWRALFPLPYWSTLKKEAERKGVDPYLVASLIRQESAFNVTARSRANALGLMQLLPRAARQYARKEKIPRWSSKKLFDPEINIRLGVAYLADTIRLHDGRLELALAAYNAGDERVESWVEEQMKMGIGEDPMEFVESIPFTETREYVQILLRNLSYYKKIYGGN